MTGTYLRHTDAPHQCLPPVAGPLHDVRDAVGTIWRCDDCQTVWRVHADILDRGHTNRRAWLPLSQLGHLLHVGRLRPRGQRNRIVARRVPAASSPPPPPPRTLRRFP